jgi:hypothetical protein
MFHDIFSQSPFGVSNHHKQLSVIAWILPEVHMCLTNFKRMSVLYRIARYGFSGSRDCLWIGVFRHAFIQDGAWAMERN